MNTKLYKKICFVLLSLVAFGLLGGVLSAISKGLGLEHKEAEIRGENASFLFAMLGGYGNVISDFIWIRSYMYREKEDMENCLSDMELAMAINPYNKTFWGTSFSIIAFDMPLWIAKDRGEAYMPQIQRIQAKKAISHLERGLEYFPNDRALLMDIALAYDQKLGDLTSAIACYEKVCEADKDLVYTRRTYADLLARDGQKEKAVAVLEEALALVEQGSEIHTALAAEIAFIKN